MIASPKLEALSTLLEPITSLTFNCEYISKMCVSPFEILNEQIKDRLNEITGIGRKEIEQISIFSLIELTPELQEYFIRLNLRKMAGLDIAFKNDPSALEKLDGCLKSSVKGEIDSLEVIREMRYE